MTQDMSNDAVRLIQKHALYVLQVFDDFCIKHDIPYTISFGTLLGAVREKGIIQWDDDIDVTLTRHDYERFISLAKSHLNMNVFVQNYQTDPQFIHAFTRLCLEDTLAVQDTWAELDFHKGIFIDVFPLDTIAPAKYMDKHARRINFYRRCKIAKLKFENETSSGPIRDWLKRIILKPVSFRFLNRKLSEEGQRYNNDPSLNQIASLMEGVVSYYYEFSFSKDYLNDIIQIPFEGNLYPAPKRSHELLIELYSNYMNLPPEKAQKPHHGFVKLKFRDDIDDLLAKRTVH